MVVFFTIMLTTKTLVYAYFFIKTGTFYLSFDDVTSSAKAGIAAGIPIGIGTWFLKKIKTSEDDTE